MAYNINLHSTQEFSSSASNAFRTLPWTFSPSSSQYLDFVIGGATPADIDIDTIIHNYISSTPGYDSIKIKTNLIVGRPGDFIESILTFSGEIADDQPGGYVLTEENLEVTNTLSFQNFQLLQAGNYNISIVFIVVGVDGNSTEHHIETVTWSITLRVSGTLSTDSVLITPESLSYEHVLNEALPATQALSITVTGAYTIQLPSLFVLSGGNIALQTDVAGIKTYQGNGTQSINVGLTTGFNSEPEGLYTGVLFGNNGVLSPYNPNSLFVLLYANSDVSLSTNLLEFMAIKNVEEAASQTVNIYGPGSVIIDAPAWLDVTYVLDGSEKYITVIPIHSDNFSPGTYTGIITLTLGGNDYTIDVQHQVFENVMLGASEEDLNFTDDYNTISHFFETTNFQLNLELDVRYFNYRFNSVNTELLTYLLGFFNYRTKYFIGQSLKNIMKELLDVNTVLVDSFNNHFPLDSTNFIRNYYNPAEVDLVANFVHKTDPALNYEKTYTNLQFIKGRKPNTPFTDTYILNYYREPLRVTPNSVCLFNFYKTQSHQMRVYKNNEYVKSIYHAPGNKRIFAYKHNFSETQPGDVLEIRLYKNVTGLLNADWFEEASNYISQKYIVFPEGPQSNHVVWEDEHGVLDCLEFTGEFKYPLGYANKTINNYKDFLEYLQKVDVKKAQKLFINTGFHLKDNTKRIDSLLSSKRAWLLSNNTKGVTSLVPNVSKYSNTDSEQDVYQLTIEFEINFTNEFEIYT